MTQPSNVTMQPNPNTVEGEMMNNLSEKTCSKCSETKPLTMFYKRSRNKDGYDGYCKACKNDFIRNYRQKYPDKYKEKVKKWNDKVSMSIKNDPVAKKEHRERLAKWRKSEKGKAVLRSMKKKQVDNLSDVYVKKLLARGTSLTHGDIPQGLVEMKKVKLKIDRKIKEMTA